MGTPISGTAGSVVYMTGGTANISEIKEWSFSGKMSPVETTAFGQDWKRIMPGIKDASGSFQGNYANDETSQVALRNAWVNNTAVALRLYEGSAYWNVGTAYITSLENGIAFDGNATISYNWEASGAVNFV